VAWRGVGWCVGAQNGFVRWLNEPEMGDLQVAAFSGSGLSLTDGFHTLTTDDAVTGDQLYNAFVYGHGPTGTYASYAYLAGYDRQCADKYEPSQLHTHTHTHTHTSI